MSEDETERHARPWFRRRALGIGGTPITWEGWVATILMVLVITATAALANPREATGPNSVILLGHVKALLGLSQVRLGIAQVLGVLAAEILVFALFVRTKTDRSSDR